MIISDKYRFVFIHIPKCAGSTVRKQIEFLDDKGGVFSNVKLHKELGQIDYGHIPLFVLKKYFPIEFRKIEKYESVTLIRNPYERFPSSVSQYLRFYGESAIHKMKNAEIKNNLNKIINYLYKTPDDQFFLPKEYIHFQKQVDFVIENKIILTNKIFTTSEVDLLIAHLENHTDIEIQNQSIEKIAQSKVYRNEFIQFLMEDIRPGLKKIYKPLLPNNLKKKLLDTFLVPRDARYQSLFQANYVIDFIEEYYKDDIALYNKVSIGNNKKISNI
ncbi:sulfotransferase family 2 domain-containing protein [Psychroflexus maritimus]|uniref:Sulfotransferase family protein n=1 Tax=Psychroflexus maritimus TaxID=2714865 RepID=A0A967ADX5_9FLAO|nr:sulfotransferase family 2 domain-containing protein [Psychroflexus maritimus]NGZ90281.1 sulfotransferase family protein [Psychroflexus maritimus]